MIDERTIFEIHRLHREGLSIRKIAQRLSLSRDSVAKYLENPIRNKIRFERPSKLDPFKEEIGRLLEIAPEASSEVIRQRLAPLGFDGGNTILKNTFAPFDPSRGEHSSASSLLLASRSRSIGAILEHFPTPTPPASSTAWP